MSEPERHVSDVLVLGAGAAGLMCAIEAARGGKRVAVLDHAERAGKKILISGGGRCNFTNLYCTPDNFLSANPHFCRSALARYTPSDFIKLVERHGIPYHEKTLGQLFCDRSAQQIVAMLEQECRAAGVRIVLNVRVTEIHHTIGFQVRTNAAVYFAPALVIATGGLSIPKMGATGFGYRVAEQFGLRIQPRRPALVPLLFTPEELSRYGDLAGVSAQVEARVNTELFREKLLFTHRGLSGPAILQASSYCKPGEPMQIDLAPGHDATGSMLSGTLPRTEAGLRSSLRAILPQRLADRWLNLHLPSDWKNASLVQFEKNLHAWSVTPAGTEGYAKAEVTAGGVDTAELSAKTMESFKVRGLFFIGEVVDVTGQLGGFNFQWAWASGFCAGQALAGRST